VVAGAQIFCCANCAAMLQQAGPGSDPQSPAHENDLRCTHCEAPIVDERAMESAGDDTFCCHNCAVAHRSGLAVGERDATRSTTA
jgi:cold shock CspA family protein